MTDGSRFPVSLRQALWVAAGVAVLTFLVVVASWLFSPRSSGAAGGPASASIKETTLNKRTFTPEPPGPGRAVSPTLPPASHPALNGSAAPTPSAEENTRGQSASPAASTAQPSPPAPPEPAATRPLASGSSSSETGRFGVQVGAYASGTNALQIKHRLEARGYRVLILERGGVHKVVVGGFAVRSEAAKTLNDLRHKGFPKAFIVPLE